MKPVLDLVGDLFGRADDLRHPSRSRCGRGTPAPWSPRRPAAGIRPARSGASRCSSGNAEAGTGPSRSAPVTSTSTSSSHPAWYSGLKYSYAVRSARVRLVLGGSDDEPQRGRDQWRHRAARSRAPRHGSAGRTRCARARLPCPVKMTSACRAANALPVSDEPAWKITGLPCGERAAPIGPADVEVAAVVIGDVNLGDVVEDSRGSSRRRWCPHPTPSHSFATTSIASSAMRYRSSWSTTPRALKLSAAAAAKLVDQVPSGSTPAEMVERKELPGEVIRVLQGRRTGEHEADALGHRRQRGRSGERFEVLGGLVSPRGRRAEVQAVGEEQRVKPARSAMRARSISPRRTPAVLLSTAGCRHGPAERVLPNSNR